MNNTAASKSQAKISLPEITQKLHNVKKTANGFSARCPNHDDAKNSLLLKEQPSGKISIDCLAGCNYAAVLSHFDLKPNDLYPNRNGNGSRAKPEREPVKTYRYTDEEGKLLYEVCRYEPKDFRQRRPNGNGGFISTLGETRRVLYRLPELVKADLSETVFLCEGEKDADNLAAIGLLSTTNAGGAKGWRDEFAKTLRQRRVVICVDRDEAGIERGKKLAGKLFDEGCQVQIFDPFKNEPIAEKHGKDVSDWLEAGNTAEDLLALIDGIEFYQPLNKEKELPDKYSLSENGLFYLGEDKVFICSPLSVTANTSDSQNESWGKLLEFEDARAGKHSLVIPMSLLSTDGAECRARLMDGGLIISANKKAREYLLNYLLTAKPKKHILCVTQLGWHEGAFVLPDEVISADESGKEILLQNVDRTANKFQTSGSLSEWQENVARYCVGNSRLMFAVCTAFAASLLPIAEDTSGGFHLHGTSSTGKTTALNVAGSVWGGDKKKGFLETWRATSNGLEAVAEAHNNSILLLDELSQVNPHEVGEIVYSLSNGFGKSRMNKNTSARRKTEWNLLFLSSGEQTLEQKMQGIGQRLFAGQETRFVSIEADANAGLGLFEQLHGFNTSDDLAKYLSSTSRKFYGAAIREFLRNVCQNRDFVEQQIKSIRNHFTAKFSPQDTSGEVYRVASRFALVAVAGILACEFCVVGWSKDDVLPCCEKLLAEWIRARGTLGNYDAAQGVKQVLAFIEQHGASRFQSLTPQLDFNKNIIPERIINRVGFKREGENGTTEFLILPEMFDREMCKGFSPIAVAKELEKLGHLRRGSDKKYISEKVTLPELGRKRVYVIAYESDFCEKVLNTSEQKVNKRLFFESEVKSE